MDGVSVTDTHKTIKMMVPVPGASKSEVQAIVRNEVQTLDGKINAAATAAKDAKTSADAIGKNVGDLADSVTQNASATKSLIQEIQDMSIMLLKRALRSDIIAIVGFGVVILAIILLGFFLGRKKNQPVTSTELSRQLTNLGRSINTNIKESQHEMEKNIPAATNKLVKKLDPFTFNFESRGHHITCTPSIDGGAYNSFHVPTSVKSAVSDPSKIKRSPTTSQGELRRDTLKLLSDFFDGKFDGNDIHSVMQKDLIAYVQKTGELVIA